MNKTDKAVVGKLSADLFPSQNSDKDMPDITINADKLDLLINKPEETVRQRNNIIIKDIDFNGRQTDEVDHEHFEEMWQNASGERRKKIQQCRRSSIRRSEQYKR